MDQINLFHSPLNTIFIIGFATPVNWPELSSLRVFKLITTRWRSQLFERNRKNASQYDIRLEASTWKPTLVFLLWSMGSLSRPVKGLLYKGQLLTGHYSLYCYNRWSSLVNHCDHRKRRILQDTPLLFSNSLDLDWGFKMMLSIRSPSSKPWFDSPRINTGIILKLRLGGL